VRPDILEAFWKTFKSINPLPETIISPLAFFYGSIAIQVVYCQDNYPDSQDQFAFLDHLKVHVQAVPQRSHAM